MFCSNGFDTMHVVCTGLMCCVHWIIIAGISTVNTGLGRPMLWKPLCLLITPEGLATTSYTTYIDYLNFHPKSSTFSKKLTQKYQKL